MTDRGLPPEGAPACPFVAFEDDRDGRSTAPDHRHRCFAETRPAPRALAHQEAYCLSSAFPVCPTFQDWARREAAAARPSAPSGGAPRDEPPQSRPMPPLERDPIHATDTPPPVPPRRGQRDWAAPPPWSGDTSGPDAGAAAAAGFAGAAAGSEAGYGADDRYPDAPPVRELEPVPSDWGDESHGLAGSAAHRLAGPDPDEPPPAIPEPSRYQDPARAADDRSYDPVASPASSRDDNDDDVEAWAAGAGAGAYVAGTATARGTDSSRYSPPPSRRPAEPARGGRPPEPRPGSQDQVSRPTQQPAQELFGPAWEPARRYEAYPTLKTRMNLPSVRGVPRLAIWGLILVLAAVILFVFGPRLLGLGGADPFGGGGAAPTPSASAEPTDSPEPTPPPAPTPQVYVVSRGDTMSKIARKFGVTVEEIMAANPQIKNPDKIDIGDEITIPAPEPENGFPDESAEP